MLYRNYSILAVVIVLISLNLKAECKLEIPRGQIVDTIKCIEDRTQSYALYLPSYYTTNKKFPIVYVFDPAARGRLPLEKYYMVAEKFGFIMVCSNNSRNGPGEIGNLAAKAMFADTRTRFTIDTSMLYTMGFSGGARVAVLQAIKSNNIKGVVACGAGYPYDETPSVYNGFTFVGVAGKTDVNYVELKILEPTLEMYKINCWFDYFIGEHNWPGKDQVDEAFLFLHFDAMRRKLIDIDSALCKQFVHYQLDSVKESNLYETYLKYKMVKTFVNQLYDTDSIDNEIDKLSENIEVQQKLENEKKYIQLETAGLKDIWAAFGQLDDYPLMWWRSKVDKLNKTIAESSDAEIKYMSARFINNIYMNAFETINNDKNNLKKTETLLQIAQIAKPDSYYPAYNLASIYAKQRKTSQAIKMLKKAIELGFNNNNFLQNDENFKYLETNQKYLEIVSGINK